MKRFFAGSIAIASLAVAAVLSSARGSPDAQVETPPELALEVEAINPWTHLEVNNNPEHFQFAIVTDRTGGHRPGVFERAVGHLNMMQPEFVVSVGDLIEGYTEDGNEIERQWAEFNGFVEQLDMPFFYTPGNHDISNRVMHEEWGRRYGRSYYFFVYRDVLFLVLNSEDPPITSEEGPQYAISPDQRDWVRRVLEENADVRWTLLFLHKPVWDYPTDNGWAAVEEALAGRDYTVFAGHYHNYLLQRRNGMNYFRLATTGGGSELRGPELGEFDHIVWVTMGPDGPVVANLLLSGILPEDVRAAP